MSQAETPPEGLASDGRATRTVGWYAELDGKGRKAWWSCFGGWALDAMDVQMYALAMPTIVAQWSLSKGQGGTLASVALLASSVGGIIAGNLADRIGRVKVLQLAILWFSFFTFLSGLTQNYEQMLIARTLQGLGFGGEWAAGAVIIAEIVAPKHRARAVSAVASGWSVGYGVAAILFTVLFQILPPETAWRTMFLLGILPAGLVIFVQKNVAEPEIYAKALRDNQGARKPSIADIFRGGLLPRTLTAWGICLGVLGGNYTVLTWLPTYLREERGLSYSSTGLYLLVNIIGSFLGYILGGVVYDKLGRRNALKLFAVVGVASVVAYLMLATSPLAIMLMGFPLGFSQSAMNSGIGPILSELFPTRLRATGQGFCYNAGRGVGALFPALVGVFSVAAGGLTAAISLFAAFAYALALIGAFALPETQGRKLDAIDTAGNA